MGERLSGALGDGFLESADPELVRAFDVPKGQVPEWMKDPEKLRFKEGEIKLSGDGVFYTMQSEGTNMGKPAVFMRLHVCNLRCVWCDTPYTWNPDMPEFWQEPKDVPVQEAADLIKATWGAPEGTIEKRLVITGGEPLIQQKTVEQVVEKLGPDWKVEVETNGTIAPSDKMIEMGVQFNCSPKLANSENSPKARIRPAVIEKFKQADTYFKFVVMKPEEIDEVENDYIKPMGIDPQRVIMMPQGVTAEEVRMNARKVFETTKAKGYRLLGRLQTEIWGAKRGV